MTKFIHIFLLSVCLSLTAKSQLTYDTGYIKKSISYQNKYRFIDTSANYIEYFSGGALKHFFDKLKTSPSERVSILHIGDSHLQADIGANYSRNFLQQIFGFGGRGSFFPYTIAKTHATYDYNVTGTGKWERTRNIDSIPLLDLGISGITARTYDSSSSFEISFISDRAKIQPDFKLLKLFCHTGPQSFDVQYQIDSSKMWEDVLCSEIPENKGVVEIKLPQNPTKIRFRIAKKDSTQKFFEIHGLSLESINRSGLLYTSVGINGAKLKSFLKENLYENQIDEFSPDLVILDLIANDLAYKNFDSTEIDYYLRECINKIRKSSPEASIMIVGMQDIILNQKHILNAGTYSIFLRNFAKNHNVAFYDYYVVSGGKYSMNKWFANGLSAKDKCHLSVAGYQLKGALFANAILNSYLYYLQNGSKPLVLKTN